METAKFNCDVISNQEDTKKWIHALNQDDKKYYLVNVNDKSVSETGSGVRFVDSLTEKVYFVSHDSVKMCARETLSFRPCYGKYLH